jgi:hypothetical protein
MSTQSTPCGIQRRNRMYATEQSITTAKCTVLHVPTSNRPSKTKQILVHDLPIDVGVSCVPVITRSLANSLYAASNVFNGSKEQVEITQQPISTQYHETCIVHLVLLLVGKGEERAHRIHGHKDPFPTS